jgi:hypothetical protein
MRSNIQLPITSATDILETPVSSNMIIRAETVTICNTTSSAISVTVNFIDSVVGLAYAIVKTVEVPAYSSLVVIDKDYPIYLVEGAKLQVQATAWGLQAICAYTIISDTSITLPTRPTINTEPTDPVISTYVGQYTATNTATSYNFTTGNLYGGSLAVVSVHNETNTGTATPPTSVTIGGVSATEAVGISSNNSGGATYSGIWYAVMIGFSYSVTVEYATAPLRMGIGVHYLTDYTSSTPVFTGSDGDTVATSVRTVNTSSLLSGSAIIAAHTSGDIYAHTWSGATERYDLPISSFTGMAGASTVTPLTQSHTITCTTDTTPTQGTALAVAAWR